MVKKRITINTPEPHSANQRILMEAFLTPGVEILIACGTKWGKSIGAAAAFSVVLPLTRGALWRWVAPIFNQAKIGFNYTRKMLPNEPYCTINRSQLPTITLNQMDSKIEFWHGQNAESLEGEGVMGYVFDEAAKMTENVYDSAHTTTTITKASKVIISTPKGKNWFYKKCMEAQEEYEWCLKMGKVPTKIYITAPSSENPAVTPEIIKNAKNTLPERLFKQYYLAEFVDNGDVFSNYKECIYGQPLKVEGPRQSWACIKEGLISGDIVIGADWAKKVDSTVFTAWDIKTKKMVAFMRFTGLNYFDGVKQLVVFSKKFEKVLMVFHDKTGLGEVIDELLDKTSLPFEGIVFSQQSKSHMVNTFILACEQKMPQLPWWPEMVKEMDAYEVTSSDIGLMKYSAPDGMHDDIVSSMILGWKGVIEFSEHELAITTVEHLASDNKLLTVADWYREIIEEEDEDNGWIELRNLT